MDYQARTLIFMGMFGSGKTEISLNIAQHFARKGERTVVVDVDTVSPYFRSRDLMAVFEEKGIKIVAPEGALAHADLPIITPQVFGYLENPEYRVVLDVGGNDDGAVVLSSLSTRLQKTECSTFYVLNFYRPFNDTVENAVSHVLRLEEKSRMKIDFLVNNSNMGFETTQEHVFKGEAFVTEVSKRTSIPVAFTALMEGISGRDGAYPRFHIMKYLKNSWEVEND